MKKIATLPLILLVCSCSTQSSSSLTSQIDNVRVVFEEGEHFTIEKGVYDVPRGEDLVVTLSFDSYYSPYGINYEGAYFVESTPWTWQLNLPNILYDTRIKIQTKRVESEIVLHLNGGEFLPEKGEGDYYRVYSGNEHLRNVLPCGIDRIEKEGYALIGWNQNPDGSGREVGLGSRDGKDQNGLTKEYYAHWEKEEAQSSFQYEIKEKEAVLLSFSGQEDIESLVIPSFFEGYPITRIASGCFSSIKASRLVLPHTLVEIEPHAFSQTKATELYFYTALEKVSDDSFEECSFQKTHILLAEPARGATFMMNTQFAENMDRLMALKEERKIIYYSGCSGSYSVISPMVEEALGNRYKVLNMGVLGDTNSTTMMECMLPYLGPGDIFVHAPEEMSCYSLLNDISLHSCYFQLYQGNFDLLLNDSPTEYAHFWDAYASWVEIQKGEKPANYGDRCIYYNEYGDASFTREDSEEDADFGVQLAYGTVFLDEDTSQRLSSYYKRIREAGAMTLFSFAPINSNAVTRLDPNRSGQASFLDALAHNVDVSIISDIHESEYPGNLFYDTDYHLSENGAKMRTERLIRDLKAYLAL